MIDVFIVSLRWISHVARAAPCAHVHADRQVRVPWCGRFSPSGTPASDESDDSDAEPNAKVPQAPAFAAGDTRVRDVVAECTRVHELLRKQTPQPLLPERDLRSSLALDKAEWEVLRRRLLRDGAVKQVYAYTRTPRRPGDLLRDSLALAGRRARHADVGCHHVLEARGRRRRRQHRGCDEGNDTVDARLHRRRRRCDG